MQPSKANLNLPTSSLHLCSPLGENFRVKIHYQLVHLVLKKKWGEDSSPREKGWVKIHQAEMFATSRFASFQKKKKKKKASIVAKISAQAPKFGNSSQIPFQI